MRRFLALFFILVFTIMLSGCNSEWQEQTAEALSSGSAPVVAAILTCSNEEAIKLDIKKKILGMSWFEKQHVKRMTLKRAGSLGLGAALCNAAVSAVLPTLIDFASGIPPAEWGCTLQALGQTAEGLARIACNQMPTANLVQ